MRRRYRLPPLFAGRSRSVVRVCRGPHARAGRGVQAVVQRQGHERLGHVPWQARKDDGRVPDLPKNEKGDYIQPLGLNRDPLKVVTVVEKDGQSAIRISGQVVGRDYEQGRIRELPPGAWR